MNDELYDLIETLRALRARVDDLNEPEMDEHRAAAIMESLTSAISSLLVARHLVN
jgi:hypothetical protein